MLNVVDIMSRLRTFGYDAIDEDILLADYLARKCEQQICNYCNISLDDIPDSLVFDATDAVCAEFLKMKLIRGEIPHLDRVFQGISSIKEGDTQINYGGASTYATMLSELLDGMALTPMILNKYRRFVW